jgi:hypothetical protein
MAASYSDKQILSSDITFQNRVRQAMIAACVNIKSESPTTVPFHRERETFLVACMNAPDSYKVLFAMNVANDANVIADATQNGTVVLTGTNVAAQAALVTDTHIDTAVSSEFNSYFRTPTS